MVAAVEVGSEAYVFFSYWNAPGDHVDTYAMIDHVDASTLGSSDFT